MTWTFKIRPGMKWSDGSPPRAEDARLDDPDRPRRGEGREERRPRVHLGRTSRTPGSSRSSAPDPETLVVTTDVPERPGPLDRRPDPAQAHLGEADARRRSATSRTTRRSSGPGRTRSSSGRPASSPASQRNPYYWGNAGSRGRDRSSSSSRTPQDTMVQAFKAGELDYIRNPSAQQFDQLKTLPGRRRRSTPRRTGSTELGVQLLRRRTSRAAAPRRRRCATRPSATPSATRSTSRRSSTRSSTATAPSGRRTVPPYYVDVPRRAGDTRGRSTSTLAKQKLDAAGYVLDASGPAPRQGRQGRSTSASTSRTRRRLRDARASSSPTGSASSGSR